MRHQSFDHLQMERSQPTKHPELISMGILIIVLLLLIFQTEAYSGSTSGSVQLSRTLEAVDLNVAEPRAMIYEPVSGLFFLLSKDRLTGFDVHGDRGAILPVEVFEADLAFLAYSPAGRKLLALDQTGTRLTEVNWVGDGLTARPRIVDYGLRDLQGFAINPYSGRLYLLDGAGPTLVLVDLASRRASRLAEAGVSEHIQRVSLEPLQGLDLNGLAYQADRNQILVFSDNSQTLFALSIDGLVLESWDLSFLQIREIGGMLVGPNADPTDNPQELGLYILDRDRSQVIELDLYPILPVGQPSLLADPTFVNSFDTSDTNWNPSSPDPIGIDYHPDLGYLIISDSEIEEPNSSPPGPPPYYQGYNIFFASKGGAQLGNCDTTTFSVEPVGVAINPDNGHIFYSDDNADEVFEIGFGPDGQYCTADDIRTSFDTRAFNSFDPEGVAYGNGRVFVSDGEGKEIYVIEPGLNGLFDGLPPAGDDSYTNFDVEVLGLTDPEGIDYSEDTGNLFVINRNYNILIEITFSGVLVNQWSIALLHAVDPASVSLAPGSVNSNETDLYISQRGVDNGADPLENDGIVFEISIGLTSALPSAVTNLDIAKSGDDAVLSWSAVVTNTNGVDLTIKNYEVYRDTDPDVDLTVPIATITTNVFTDTAVLDDGINYYYAVLATDTRGLKSTSSNLAGVFGIPVLEGWNMLSWPFQPSDTSLDSVLGDQLTGTADPLTADRVLVWNASTQTYDHAWFCAGPTCESWGPDYANHWLADDYSISTITLSPDAGFWVQNRSGAAENLVVVGRIFNTARQITITPGWEMLGISFLDSRPLDSADLPATGTADPLTADRILFWDAALQQYQHAWFCAGATCESWGPEYNNHWLADDYGPTDIVLLPGHGFWFQNRHAELIWTVIP